MIRRNFELKARVQDLHAVRRLVSRWATSGPEQITQTDTYFACATGRLKLREEPGSETTLIWYVRDDRPEIRTSDYMIVPIPHDEAMKHVLIRSLGRETIVQKSRELWWFRNVRIHLDQVLALGTFIELEGVVTPQSGDAETRQTVHSLIDKLELRQPQWISCSYRELMMGQPNDSSPS